MSAAAVWSWAAMVCGLLIVAWVLLGAHIDPNEKDYNLDDGRTVHCLVQSSMFARSISCDWENAKVKP